MLCCSSDVMCSSTTQPVSEIQILNKAPPGHCWGSHWQGSVVACLKGMGSMTQGSRSNNPWDLLAVLVFLLCLVISG